MAHTEPRAVGRTRSERGFTLIDLLFVVGLIALLSSLAVPGLTRARGAAQASSAVASLRTINSGQLSYAISCGLGFYAPDLPSLGARPPGATEAFLGRDLTAGVVVLRSGFEFELFGTGQPSAPASCNGVAAGQGAPGYKVVADPIDPAITRFFGSNASGMLWENYGASLWGAMPEAQPSPVGTPIKY
jgi:type II secretory pathway pseudopilin PulG